MSWSEEDAELMKVLQDKKSAHDEGIRKQIRFLMAELSVADRQRVANEFMPKPSTQEGFPTSILDLLRGSGR